MPATWLRRPFRGGARSFSEKEALAPRVKYERKVNETKMQDEATI